MTPVKESTAYQPPKTLWNASYLLILAVSTLSSFSFYMTATIMSKYLVSLGATIAFAGVVVGLFSITSLVCRPFCGLMADRLNNIWLLIVSNILMGIGMVGFALMRSMPLMIVFRIINAVGFAINGTVQMAAAVHFIPKDRTAEGIGYMGISQLIGSACAPAVGLEIANAWGIDSEATDNNVEVYISFLRKKLKYLGSRVSIRKLQRIGYRLEVGEC